MIHIDTHVAIWLFAGHLDKLSEHAKAQLQAFVPRISPTVRLELAMLHQIGRLNTPPAAILDQLSVDLGLQVAESPFYRVSAIAAGLTWTRDPFDRLIAAHAMADDLPLLTRDRRILEHCPVAIWTDPNPD